MLNSFNIEKWEVIVGNIGRVYQDDNWNSPLVKEDAEKEFKFYAAQSVNSVGRAANEPVWLLCNGEVVDEVEGKQED